MVDSPDEHFFEITMMSSYTITLRSKNQSQNNNNLHIDQGDIVDECDDGFMVGVHDWTI